MKKLPKSILKQARLQARESYREISRLAIDGGEGADEAQEMIDSWRSQTTMKRWLPQAGELVYDMSRGAGFKRICLVISSDPATGLSIVLDSESGGAQQVWISYLRPVIDDEA